MLPFVPEPLRVLRARYHKALFHVYNEVPVVVGLESRPGGSRRQVFDFPDGLRLIVSRDRNATGVIRLHVSASLAEGVAVSKLNKIARTKGPGVASARLRDLGTARFAELDPTTKLTFLGFSPGKGVPHWDAEDPVS